MKRNLVELIEESILNMELSDKLNLVLDINSYDGSLEHLYFQYNDEEFFNTYFENKPMEAVRATTYGNYNYMDEYVIFNGYGNLDSYNSYQVENEIDESIGEIVERLIELKDNIYICSEEIESLLNELEE